MSAISLEELNHILKLAHLDIEEGKKALFLEQLTKIFGHMEELNKLNVTDLQPIAHAFDSETLLRDDEVHGSVLPFISENAPQWENGCFQVPKILEA